VSLEVEPGGAAPGVDAGLRVRPAVASDLPGVLELWIASGTKPTPTDDLPALQKLLERDPEALLLIDDDGVVAASLIAGFDGWRANLYRLAVLPAYRRRGLARTLVLDAAERLRARGARRVSAFVLRDDARAVGFWTSLEADGLYPDSTKRRWILALDGPPSPEF
jgi:ribosomal protein S18 acetylase RimI-like enzyme